MIILLPSKPVSTLEMLFPLYHVPFLLSLSSYGPDADSQFHENTALNPTPCPNLWLHSPALPLHGEAARLFSLPSSIHRHLPNSYLPFKTQFKLISLVMPLLTPPGRVISSILLPHSILLLISPTALIIFLIRFDYALCPMLNSKLLKIATNLFFFFG